MATQRSQISKVSRRRRCHKADFQKFMWVKFSDKIMKKRIS